MDFKNIILQITSLIVTISGVCGVIYLFDGYFVYAKYLRYSYFLCSLYFIWIVLSFLKYKLSLFTKHYTKLNTKHPFKQIADEIGRKMGLSRTKVYLDHTDDGFASAVFGSILLSPQLLKFSRDEIEFIIAHELSHVKKHHWFAINLYGKLGSLEILLFKLLFPFIFFINFFNNARMYFLSGITLLLTPMIVVSIYRTNYFSNFLYSFALIIVTRLVLKVIYRRCEFAADKYAVSIVGNSGAIRFFQRFSEKKSIFYLFKRYIYPVFAFHPSNIARKRNISL